MDRATQHLILHLLAALNRERGLAVLLVTHDLAMLREFAHKVVWVEDGRAELCEVDEALRAWSTAGGRAVHERPPA